jgi:hypothetical protein
LDVKQSISLYEQAWGDKLTVSAYELGNLYEHVANPTDSVRAWAWYQKAAVANEPNSLARFAERADAAAFEEQRPIERNRLMLEAFKYYAAAADRPRREDWPDEAWRNWRYRRASPARLLARAGKMKEVAEMYDSVLSN